MEKIACILLSVILLISCKKTEDEADAYGNFEAEEILLSAETPGKIVQMQVDLGDQIKTGDTLALIDTTTQSLQMQQLFARKKAVLAQKPQLKAQMEVTHQQLENVQRDYARIQKMHKDGAATEKQMDDAEGQLLVLKKQIEAINTQMATIDANVAEITAQQKLITKQIEDCFLTAPSSGTILNKYAEPGELVSPGKTLFKMANLSTLDLRIFVSGKQLSSIKLGDELTVQTDDVSGMYSDKGVVTWISSKAEFTPKTIQTKEERVDMVYAVKLKVKNTGRYKLGMPAEVRFKDEN